MYFSFFFLARKSFPSQHATLAAFAAVYISVSNAQWLNEACCCGYHKTSPLKVNLLL